MNSNKSLGASKHIPISLVALGAGVGALLTLWLRRRERTERAHPPKNGWSRAYTEAYPPGSGAQISTIDGHPEDLNGMPATGYEGTDVPIYDGSDLRH